MSALHERGTAHRRDVPCDHITPRAAPFDPGDPYGREALAAENAGATRGITRAAGAARIGWRKELGLWSTQQSDGARAWEAGLAHA